MSNKSTVTFEDLNDDNYLKGIASRDLQTCEIARGRPGAGYLSKELINKMIITMKRAGHSFTHLYVSPEDVADIIEWSDTDFDPVTKRELVQAGEAGVFWNITIYKRYCLKDGSVYGFSFVDGIVDAVCVGIIDRF